MSEKNEYSFERLIKDLDNGFQIYFNYLNNRYLIYKTSSNCYTQELITFYEKNPQPRIAIITLKRLTELFLSMEEIEYKS